MTAKWSVVSFRIVCWNCSARWSFGCCTLLLKRQLLSQTVIMGCSCCGHKECFVRNKWNESRRKEKLFEVNKQMSVYYHVCIVRNVFVYVCAVRFDYWLCESMLVSVSCVMSLSKCCCWVSWHANLSFYRSKFESCISGQGAERLKMSWMVGCGAAKFGPVCRQRFMMTYSVKHCFIEDLSKEVRGGVVNNERPFTDKTTCPILTSELQARLAMLKDTYDITLTLEQMTAMKIPNTYCKGTDQESCVHTAFGWSHSCRYRRYLWSPVESSAWHTREQRSSIQTKDYRASVCIRQLYSKSCRSICDSQLQNTLKHVCWSQLWEIRQGGIHTVAVDVWSRSIKQWYIPIRL